MAKIISMPKLIIKKESKLLKTDLVVFPEESGLIVEEIIEKTGLKKIDDEKFEKLLNPETPNKKTEEIFEDLPSVKLSKIIIAYAEGKIDLKNLSSSLKKDLSISFEKAEEIGKELKEKLLVYIKPIKKEKTKTIQLVPIFDKKPRTPTKKDVYRELIN